MKPTYLRKISLSFLLATLAFLAILSRGYCDTIIRLDMDVPGAADSVNPQIASDESGHVYAVWEDSRNGLKDIYFNYSSDKGLTWQSADIRLDLDAPGSANSVTPKIICDNNGYVYIVWQDSRNGKADIYLRNGAIDVSGTLILGEEEKRLDTDSPASYNSTQPQICIDGSGNVYVVWVEGSHIYLRASTDNAFSWNTVQLLDIYPGEGTSSNPNDRPRIECDNNGRVYVIYRQFVRKPAYNAEYQKYFVCSLDHGATWQAPLPLSGLCSVPELGLACDNNGYIYALWSHSPYGSGELYFNYSEDYGTTWQSADIRIDTDPWTEDWSSYSSILTCDNNGNVYVVWNDCGPVGSRNSESIIQFRSATNHGASWREVIHIDKPPVYWLPEASLPAMTSDDNGNIYVVYRKGTSGGFSYSTDYGNTWILNDFITPTTMLESMYGILWYPSISADRMGHVYPVWYAMPDGKYDIYFKLVTIAVSYPSPVANFTASPTSGDAPLTVSFTDTSTGNIISRMWDFGDSTTSAEQNPSHTYNNPGTYMVSLTVTGPGGSDTETKTNYINVLPPPNNPPLFCPWESWTINEGEPYTWVILVADSDGDSFTLTVSNMPEGMQFDGYRTFKWQPGGTQAGDYSILLTATDEHGAASSLNMAITVRDTILPPVAAFIASPTEGTAPLTVNLTDASTGDITERLWDFGDGATSTEQNPSHTYKALGTYTLGLTVTGPGGSDTAVKENYINAGISCDTRLDTDAPGAADSRNSQIASDGKGNVYTVWEDLRNGASDIYLNYSTNRGLTWQDEDIRLDMGTPGTAASLNPQVVCDESGYVYVVWQDARNGAADIYLRKATMDESGVLQLSNAEKRLDTDTPGSARSINPQLCSDGNGNIYVTWEDKRTRSVIYANYSHDFGQTWQAQDIWVNVDELTYLMSGSIEPQICCDKNGNVYITWSSAFYSPYATNYVVRFKCSNDFGNTWQAMKCPNFSTFNIYAPDISCDDSGNVYLACYETGIRFNKSSDYGNTWLSGGILISPNAWSSEKLCKPQIDSDDQGNVYVIWEYGLPRRHHDIRFNCSHDHGTTWQSEDIVFTDNEGTSFRAQNPRISSDDNGNIYAVWQNNTDGLNDIYFNYSQDYGVTWQAENIQMNDELDGSDAISPQISSDNKGNVYIAWSDNRDIKYDIYFNRLKINIPPRLNPIGNKETCIGKYLMFPVSAVDYNGDKLRYGAENLPDGASFIQVSEAMYDWMKKQYPDMSYPCYLFYWRPRGNQTGEYKVTFWVEDLNDSGEAKHKISETIIITVKMPPNAPPTIYDLRNYRNTLMSWRGYDKEDRNSLEYSYKIDSNDWSKWSRSSCLSLYSLSKKLSKGWHVLQVKARDKEGLESITRAIQFYVR